MFGQVNYWWIVSDKLHVCRIVLLFRPAANWGDEWQMVLSASLFRWHLEPFCFHPPLAVSLCNDKGDSHCSQTSTFLAK